MVQHPQPNTPTAVNNSTPLADTTPEVKVEDTPSPTLVQEPDSCQPKRSAEMFTVVNPEPKIEARPRPRQQRLPLEMMTCDYFGNPATHPPIISSCYVRPVRLNNLVQPIKLNMSLNLFHMS